MARGLAIRASCNATGYQEVCPLASWGRVEIFLVGQTDLRLGCWPLVEISWGECPFVPFCKSGLSPMVPRRGGMVLFHGTFFGWTAGVRLVEKGGMNAFCGDSWVDHVLQHRLRTHRLRSDFDQMRCGHALTVSHSEKRQNLGDSPNFAGRPRWETWSEP